MDVYSPKSYGNFIANLNHPNVKLGMFIHPYESPLLIGYPQLPVVPHKAVAEVSK